MAVIGLAVLLVFLLNRGDGGLADGGQTTASTAVATTAPGAATPEQVTMRLFTALENQDLDAFLGLLDTTLVETFPTGAALDSAKAALKQDLAALGTIKFSDIELSTTMNDQTNATVTVTAGTVTVTSPDGKVTSQNVEDAPTPVIINLVLRDGGWYVASSPFL